MVISASLQAWGVVFPFAMLTSICRSIVTICSGLYLLIGMTRFSSKWILSHSTWYKSRRSGHLGWRFAALSGQDTRKWQRKGRQNQYLLTAEATQGLRRPRGSTTEAKGFANAGFLARPRLPAGFIPTGITNGDFNEDGKMDFAISNGGDNTIYVFLGNGDGTFKVPEILYTQGQSPNWITAVKLRKNGHLDLAVTDGDSNTVEVFPGNGDGTFQPSTQTSLPQIPSFILAADFNNDGNQDLVVGLVLDLDATEPQIEVLLGNGAG